MKKYIRSSQVIVGDDYPEIDEGAKVWLNRRVLNDGESPVKYFVSDLSKGYCLLADNKAMYREGRGYIYSIWNIEKYQVF